MLGVVSSIAADAGYLVLVPLGAAAFHSLGRHPLAGLAAAFSGVAAVFLVNLFVTPTDALLAEMTNDAIRMVDPSREVTLVGNLYFMIVSSILMGIVCTIITEKIVEPHLGPYSGEVPVEEQHKLTPTESHGLRRAGIALLGFVVVIALLTAPPGAPLRHAETGEIISGSPFMSGLIVLISALFFTVGFAYGKATGTVPNLTAAINMVVKTFSGMAGLIFLLLVIAQFVAFFSFTNIATVLAANLADFLETVPLGMTSYIVIFILVIFLLDLILTGAVAKWAIFAPVFIPLFMRLGGDPNLVLAAYRVGDSPANVITPLNVYLGVMVGFAARYQKDAGIGTIVSLMLPYTVVLLVLWTLLLVAWHPARPAARAGLTTSEESHVRPRQGARPHRRRPRRRARAAVRHAAAEVDLDRPGLCRRDPGLRRVARRRPRARSASTRACATPPATRWWSATSARATGRRCCSTAITTCSRSTRSSSGSTTRSTRRSSPATTARR